MDYFYHKEHLLIVTELLRDSIFNFYRYLRDTSPEGHGAYFTLDTLRALSTQLLSALAFMHQQVCSHHNCLRSCRNQILISTMGVPRQMALLSALCNALLTRTCFVSYLHVHRTRQNIVHCDLKPENVCIASASRRKFKIIDVRAKSRSSKHQVRWHHHQRPPFGSCVLGGFGSAWPRRPFFLRADAWLSCAMLAFRSSVSSLVHKHKHCVHVYACTPS